MANQNNRANKVKKIVAADNIYTVVLALAVGVVLATAAYVAFQSYSRYEIIFAIGRSFGY